MKKLIKIAMLGLLAQTSLGGQSGKWTTTGQSYYANDDYRCSGNRYTYVFAKEQGGGDFLGKSCTVVGAKISVVIGSTQGWDCSDRALFQDMECVGTLEKNPLDEYVSGRDTFTLKKLRVAANSTEIVKIGTVRRPGYVLMYTRTHLDLIAKEPNSIGIKVLQTGSMGIPYFQEVFPYNKEAFVSDNVAIVRNSDSSGNNPGDETLGDFFILVQNESEYPATLKNLEVLVNSRAD